MRKRIVAGNWKMNTTPDEGISMILTLVNNIKKSNLNPASVIVIPPFTHLTLFSEVLNENGIGLGCQNIYHKKSGAFTGEISVYMVKNAGVKYVITGHSERRQYFQEDNHLLAEKLKLVLENDLTPIYCCGEKDGERKSGIHFDIIRKQVEEGLFGFTAEQMQKIIIAYEPVWAIGTGNVATPGQAQEIHFFIRNLLSKKYGKLVADEISILYGGSIKASNSPELFSQPDIDGGLVGGASLDMTEFTAIIKSL